MNKTTVKKLFHSLVASMKLITVSYVVAYSLLLCSTPSIHAKTVHASTFRQISWPEIESLLSNRRFVSQEELFQLLHHLQSRQQNMISLDKPVIQKLARTIKSLLPLDACESIILESGTVSIFFNKPQDIYIPNSWHQASLKISKHLVLRIENDQKTDSPHGLSNPVENDIQSVRFTIEQGYLQLDFSFLLKIFGNQFRDGQGSELLYQINEEKHNSSLSLIEVTPLTQHDLSVNKRKLNTPHREYSWVDIHHSDFPDTKDIGISDNRISFLGMDIELHPDDIIRFGDEEPRHDSKTYHYFKTGIERFKALLFTDGKPITIDYTRTFGYQFEERKLFVTIGFRSTEDKRRIM